MSTTALTGLRDYLVGTLSESNLYWLATELTEYAKKKDAHRLKPYTMEEINAMIDQSERDSAAGLGQDSEEMFSELEEEFAREELEIVEAVDHRNRPQFLPNFYKSRFVP